MATTSSGRVLREARERKGYDLNTVARRLRIRPDILRAIESSDFAAMPPRGYTRNMVNAYAKLLGLNPTEIVNMYLDEAYADQVERARDTAPSSGFNLQRETRRSRSQLGVGEGSGAETRAIPPANDIADGGTRQFTRVLYDDGTRFSRDDYGVTRERANRPGKSERDFSSHHSGYSANDHGHVDNSPKRGNRGIYAGQTPMQYSASRLPAFLQSRTALIALGAAVVVLIVIVLVVVLGGRGSTESQDVSALPVSGISDTTESSSSSAATAAEVAPTSAHVVYSVKSGEECYVEIYVDGQMTPETLTGPAEKTADVTGTWTITTWSPENLTLTVDGEKAELKTSTEYGGMYAYTVDFAQILKAWQVAHGQASAASTTATSASSGAAAAAATATGAAAAQQAQGNQSQDDGTNYVEPAGVDDGSQNEGLQTQGEDEQQYDEENYDESYDEEGYDGSYEGEEYYDEGVEQ